MPSVRVKFDEKSLEKGIERVLNDKLKKGLSDNVKYLATSYYRDAIAEYVPEGPSYKGHRGGALRRSAFKEDSIVKDGDGYAVRYSATSPKGYDYADVQYQPEKYGKNEAEWERYTPNTYSHWNRHLTAAGRDFWYGQVADLIIEGMNDG